MPLGLVDQYRDAQKGSQEVGHPNGATNQRPTVSRGSLLLSVSLVAFIADDDPWVRLQLNNS